MNRTAWATPWVLISLAGASAACEPHCPKGYDKRGNTCYRKDAGADAGGDADGGSDDGGDIAGDAADKGEEDAGPSLDRPEIRGAGSMAPSRELWTWSTPSGTDYFELLIDDAAPRSGERQEEPRFSAPLELGDHTLKVRACGADQHCSEWSSHTTRVESFGANLPRGLRDAARAIPTTALGHPVAIGCNDCGDGPRSEVYDLNQAAASVERAIERGADFIELNVAAISGTLHVSPTDSASVGVRPRLTELLGRDKIATADALLVLEVIENEPASQDSEPPEALAKSFFSVIEEVPSIARNGRPLWLRASYANRSYLQALAEESKRHAITGPYVRFVIGDPGKDPATFYGEADGALIPNLDFLDAVSVDYRLPNLPFRLERIRAAGNAAILENVPGPLHGEVVLAALRDQVDGFITNYRVDQARSIVVTHDTASHFSERDISGDGRVLTIRGVLAAALRSWGQELGWVPPNGTFGFPTPSATLSSPTGDFFGSFLSFQLPDAPEYGASMNLGNEQDDGLRDYGFLLSLSGTFPPNPAGVATVIYSPESFELAIEQDGRLRMHADATTAEGDRELFVPMSGDVACDSQNGTYSSEFLPQQPHWIVAAYDGASRFSLFVDGRCAGEIATVLGSAGFDPRFILLGMGKGPGNLPRFQGLLQQASVLRWKPNKGHGEN